MRRIVLILVISILTACSGDAPPTPEATAAVELPQNYRAEITDGTVSLNYPENWAVGSEFPQLRIAVSTSEDLANNNNFTGTLSSGEVYLEILFAPESARPNATVETIMNEIVTSIGTANGTMSEVQKTTLNGKEAQYISLDGENSGSDGLFMVIDVGDAFATVVVGVADGELEQHQDTTLAIVGSIDYTLNSSQ